MTNPYDHAISPQTQLETSSTLANAIGLARIIFDKVAGREISNLEHHDSSVDDLIAANINKHIASK